MLHGHIVYQLYEGNYSGLFSYKSVAYAFCESREVKHQTKHFYSSVTQSVVVTDC